jgi:hypothetical protein
VSLSAPEGYGERRDRLRLLVGPDSLVHAVPSWRSGTLPDAISTGWSATQFRDRGGAWGSVDGAFDPFGQVEDVRDGVQNGDLDQGAIAAIPAAVLVVGVVGDREPGSVSS